MSSIGVALIMYITYLRNLRNLRNMRKGSNVVCNKEALPYLK